MKTDNKSKAKPSTKIMLTIKVSIVSLFVIFLIACSSTPFAAPTSTTTIPMIEIKVEDALLTTKDLTFGGFYEPSDWSICPNLPSEYETFEDYKDDIISVGTRDIGITCNWEESESFIYQQITIVNDSKQAERMLADLLQTEDYSQKKWDPFDLSMIDSIDVLDLNLNGKWIYLWILDNDVAIRFTVDEAIIIITIWTEKPLSTDDYIEVINSAMAHLDDARNPNP